MKQLKAFLQALIGKFKLWLARRKIKVSDFEFTRDTEISESMGKLMNIRMVQGATVHGKPDLVLGGDSIFHGFEPIAYREFGGKIFNAAIGGNRTEWIARSPAHILTSGARKLVLHTGGNDLLSGASVDDAIESLIDLHSVIGYAYPTFYVFEILPLGHIADFPEAAKLKVDNLPEVIANVKDVTLNKIPLYNAKLRSLPFVITVPVYSQLQRAPGEAWIKREFGSGDLIHVNDKAYYEVYVPAIRNILENS